MSAASDRLAVGAEPAGPVGVDSAREFLLRAIESPASAVTRSLPKAVGTILAADVVAPISLPHWDNSAMDGYALRHAYTLRAAGRALPVSAYVPAGTAPAPIAPGTAVRIFTGAPVPKGADTVVMQEHCRDTCDGVVVDKLPDRGANIRRAGEDVQRGATVLNAGRRVSAADVGMVAALGLTEVAVHPRPRVIVLATGDELAPPGASLGGSQIYESNGRMLAALVAGLGTTVDGPHHVPDTPAATRAAVAEAAASSDLVVSSGGVSVGDADHVRAAVCGQGSLELWKIAVKPGKPIAFGCIGETPFLGLPGNPVSAFVTFALFGAPIVRKLQGRRDLIPAPLPMAAAFEHACTHGREEYLRVRIEQGRLVAYPQQGSGVISSLGWAEGLARVPAHGRVSPGDCVEYYPMESLLS